MQNTPLINDFYGEYIKNSYNSKVRRRQINRKKGDFGAKALNRHFTKDVFNFITHPEMQNQAHNEISLNTNQNG